MRIRLISQGEAKYWDEYVYQHPKATLCHLHGWGRVIRDTYGHPFYGLIAENPEMGAGKGIRGVLPLVHVKSLLFGSTIVSMPFLNYGGLLANDEHTEKRLLEEAVKLGRDLQAKNIELRHSHPNLGQMGRG